MNYNEINFHKQNRRPVTDTTYQIAAEEWNAIGAELSSHRARLANIENIQTGGQGDLSGFVTDEELEEYQGEIAALIGSVSYNLITAEEYAALGRNKEFRYYFVARDAADKAAGKCWKIYLKSQLVGTFNVDGSLTIPKFPMRFPFRFA